LLFGFLTPATPGSAYFLPSLKKIGLLSPAPADALADSGLVGYLDLTSGNAANEHGVLHGVDVALLALGAFKHGIQLRKPQLNASMTED
jgi:hypothetical protein